MPTISVIVPAHNEESVLSEFHERLGAVLDSLPLEAEVIYVNDGSRDGTLDILRRLKADDPRVAILDLSRNFGKEAAMTAGLQAAAGDAVVVVDADLQDPPELIRDFVKVWQDEGTDIVYGQRTERRGETWFKKMTASQFYKLMQYLGQVRIPQDAGDFRLISRRALDALNELPEQHRFMKGLFAWVGFEQRAVPYERDPRHSGASKWNYWRLWNFALEGITSFTVVPLQVASYLGILVALAAFIYGGFLIVKTLLFGNPVAGYPSLMTVVLFLGGLQLLFIGVVGEYLGRIFNETKRRPLYFVKGFEPSALQAAPRQAPRPVRDGQDGDAEDGAAAMEAAATPMPSPVSRS